MEESLHAIPWALARGSVSDPTVILDAVSDVISRLANSKGAPKEIHFEGRTHG